ncbi:GntR family transcriptional regulator [Aliirhizobium smilacinae]|nr:GntR family transcriptional regulator [Rhizobium smilacinae]
MTLLLVYWMTIRLVETSCRLQNRWEPSLISGVTSVRRTLHSEIVDAIREMIVDGHLEPGQKVPEKELCDRFDISRTPLREALKALAAEGMLELLPQRGARVAILGEEELVELFPIIAAMEALAGELACDRITDAQVAEIRQMHGRMLIAFEQSDRLEYATLNRAIHMAIFDASGNAALLVLYRNMELKIRNIRHTMRQLPQDWKQALDDHDEMLDALSARDKTRLSAIMKQHVLNTAEAVRHSVDDLKGQKSTLEIDA